MEGNINISRILLWGYPLLCLHQSPSSLSCPSICLFHHMWKNDDLPICLPVGNSLIGFSIKAVLPWRICTCRWYYLNFSPKGALNSLSIIHCLLLWLLIVKICYISSDCSFSVVFVLRFSWVSRVWIVIAICCLHELNEECYLWSTKHMCRLDCYPVQSCSLIYLCHSRWYILLIRF